jgi:glycosyltransferase involved in cell wall biosynthesis
VNTLVSIAIPAFNRPALLCEGLKSIAEQTYPHWEVVIIDDGSVPPIQEQKIRSVIGDRFKLIRHNISRGVVAAKNAGVQHAGGDIIMHLDDDDLLAPETLEIAVRALEAHSELDGVYLNVAPFGKREAGSRRNQDRALDTVLREATAKADGDLIFLNDHLFEVLLRTVPMAFQRPVARRQAWLTIGDTDESFYFGEPDWALRAAIYCNFALLKPLLAKWRVDGQNFASQPVHRLKHSSNNIRIKQHILEVTCTLPDDRRSLAVLARRALGLAYFDHAYQLLLLDKRLEASRFLLKSVATQPAINQAKLFIRLLLPHSKRV